MPKLAINIFGGLAFKGSPKVSVLSGKIGLLEIRLRMFPTYLFEFIAL